MLVLGIDTSCDDTAMAVVEDGRIIHSNVIVSQNDLLQKYGGVYPEMACRRHIDLCEQVANEALAGFKPEQVDLIAATRGPGLIGALLIGLNFAKALSLSLGRPFIAVNHLTAHLHAAMMQSTPPTPALGVILSGGHSCLGLFSSKKQFTLVGQTMDDAMGEAFDKVARMLDLPFPGGAALEELAKGGDPHRYPFKGGESKENPYFFSFSGLKTAVLYEIQKGANPADVAASFQQAAISLICKKIELAVQAFAPKSIILGGGVCNSQTLRAKLQERFDLPLYFPPKGLCLDNGAMIAALGYHEYQQRGADSLDINAEARIPFTCV